MPFFSRSKVLRYWTGALLVTVGTGMLLFSGSQEATAACGNWLADGSHETRGHGGYRADGHSRSPAADTARAGIRWASDWQDLQDNRGVRPRPCHGPECRQAEWPAPATPAASGRLTDRLDADVSVLAFTRFGHPLVQTLETRQLDLPAGHRKRIDRPPAR